MKSLKDIAERYALQNAALHGGKASEGSVLGKLLASSPDFKKDIGKARTAVKQAVYAVNSMGPQELAKRLSSFSPEAEEKKKEEGLPALEGAEAGKMATRFAPAPTGPLHISHLLRAAFLSYLYAKKYGGKFYLRIEDTDPKKVKKEFYDYIIDDLSSVGIKPDEIHIESEDIDIYYKKAEELLSKGKAYVCLCDAEGFRKLKLERKPCPHREIKGLKQWEDMLSGKLKEGEAVVRLKTSMRDKNPVLRDPPIMRISDGTHPLKPGTKVWPLYNFACAIEDHKAGITHVFRAKEHEHNTAVQNIVYGLFRWPKPTAINFGMIYLQEGKVHKRDMRKGMESGQYAGWDDVRLPTVRAFLRRGFQPEAFRRLAEKTGLTKNDITLGMENLEGINRKLIDPIALRYFAVTEPKKIRLEGIDDTEIRVPNHPDFPEKGNRPLKVKADEVYIQEGDFKSFGKEIFRLIGLGNFRLRGSTAVYEGNKVEREMRKIQFVSSPNISMSIIGPKGDTEGLGEESMRRCVKGDIIHMPRIGFARVDSVSGEKITLAFAHK